jgi:hypothetical protein
MSDNILTAVMFIVVTSAFEAMESQSCCQSVVSAIPTPGAELEAGEDYTSKRDAESLQRKGAKSRDVANGGQNIDAYNPKKANVNRAIFIAN